MDLWLRLRQPVGPHAGVVEQRSETNRRDHALAIVGPGGDRYRFPHSQRLASADFARCLKWQFGRFGGPLQRAVGGRLRARGSTPSRTDLRDYSPLSPRHPPNRPPGRDRHFGRIERVDRETRADRASWAEDDHRVARKDVVAGLSRRVIADPRNPLFEHPIADPFFGV